MIPATAKQVFCQFHCTCWFPPRQHVQEKARAVWAELPKEASRVTNTSGHCSYSQECPVPCLALGIFSTNRGKAERGNHLVPGKNNRTPWRGGRRAGDTEGSGSEHRAISQKGAPLCGLVALCCAPTTPRQRGPSPVLRHTWRRGPAEQRAARGPVCPCRAVQGALRCGLHNAAALSLPRKGRLRVPCSRL